MKYRIYYKTPGVTCKRTPCETIKAPDAESAVDLFRVRHRSSSIIAIFAVECENDCDC